MSEPFIAEIRIFAGNFAPRSWAFCNGQLLPIAQNTALFSIIGTIYGGDGRTTTALPNMQGRTPMHPGRGPGLSARSLGENGGATTVTLNQTQMPTHTHIVEGSARQATQDDPGATQLLAVPVGNSLYAPPNNLGSLRAEALKAEGGGQAHPNMQPYLALNFIIALQGVYPSRS